MITKRRIIGHRDILEDGQIQLRFDTIIEEDGVELSRTYHRQVLEPGQNVSQLPQRVQQTCATEWTPQVIADYLAAKATRQRP